MHIAIQNHRKAIGRLLPCACNFIVKTKIFRMKRILFLFMLPATLSVSAQQWAKNFDFVDQCICGLSLVEKDNKHGYVDLGGNIVIPLIYDEGLTFNEGYAAVRLGNHWLYLDSTGKQITEAIYGDAQSFHDGLAAVSKGGLAGFINTSGKVVIDFKFDQARGFAEGLAPVSNKKGYWGYIDLKGDFVIQPEYDFADSFENGEARVIKGDKVYYIDAKNKMLHE